MHDLKYLHTYFHVTFKLDIARMYLKLLWSSKLLWAYAYEATPNQWHSQGQAGPRACQLLLCPTTMISKTYNQ